MTILIGSPACRLTAVQTAALHIGLKHGGGPAVMLNPSVGATLEENRTDRIVCATQNVSSEFAARCPRARGAMLDLRH